METNLPATVSQAADKSGRLKAVLVMVGLLLIIGNLLLLDWKLLGLAEQIPSASLLNQPDPDSGFQQVSDNETGLIPGSGVFESEPVISEAPAVEVAACPESCLQAINQATEGIEGAKEVVSQPIDQGDSVKEIYIPFGHGTTYSLTYTELAGIEAVIDKDNYPNVKSMIFEATMRIPTANGQMYAKLYNVTDKHEVWFSEVTAEGPTGYRAESGEISLDPGRKLYRVMVKSTMGYEAILDSARIKIILK